MSRGIHATWNALIRTHHITSRRKVASLKQAASEHGVFALLCSGGTPGIMYVEGSETGVKGWVEHVHKLRYKDYRLAIKPGVLANDDTTRAPIEALRVGVDEVSTVRDFGDRMAQRALHGWWRKGMGYVGDDNRL